MHIPDSDAMEGLGRALSEAGLRAGHTVLLYG
jgi:hypothetical protein